MLFLHHQLTFSIASEVEIERAIKAYYRTDATENDSGPEVPEDFSIITFDESARTDIALEDEHHHDDKKILLVEFDIDRGKALRAILRREGYDNVTWVSSDPEAERVLLNGNINIVLMSEAAHHRNDVWLARVQKHCELPPCFFYRAIAPFLFGQELPYQAMGESMTSLVGALVRDRLQGDPDRLHETLDRVRYCKLLSLRMQFGPARIDRSVLAAWFAGNREFQPLLPCFSSSFELEKVLEELEQMPVNPSPESQLLTIVKHLLELKRWQPDIFNDIQLLRPPLRERCPRQVPDAMIETLISLLQDEEFVNRIDKPVAHIVLIDGSLTQESGLVLRLKNDGYETTVVKRAQDALNMLNKRPVDCFISEIKLDDIDGMQLCKTIKNHPSHEAIPFIFMAADQDTRSIAECLRAGADDFLAKPVDWEVLSLKLHRILTKKLGHDSRAGIKGTLSQLCFSDLVQILSSTQKSVRIVLSKAGVLGELFMDHGEIVHAVCENSIGEGAFYRLMRCNEGEFEVTPCSTFPRKTIALSVMGLLMEGARIDDEMKKDGKF
jgi:DNA-binding response OmpR family regulator